MTRFILHVDMDAFYASIEQRDHPEYRGKPVIVGADPKDGRGRGVVAACSYEARKFGVRSALPITKAWRLCPNGVYVRPRMQKYVEVSQAVMEVLRQFTDLVEPLSIDEAFLDVTGSVALFGRPESIARAIKSEVLKATELTASVGVAPNKFVAKIASDLRKPDGLVVVTEDQVHSFLDRLPIARLWGVGPKMEARLHRLGIQTIGHLAALPRERLVLDFGAMGEHLWQLSNGRDDRPVVPNWDPKSISNEVTFDEDTADLDLLLRTLQELSDHVAKRLRRETFRARKVTLKLRYTGFETHTKQMALKSPVETGNEIFAVAKELFATFRLDRKIRLLGVGGGDLVKLGADPEQLPLFGRSGRQEEIERALDDLDERFGSGTVRRASEIAGRAGPRSGDQ